MKTRIFSIVLILLISATFISAQGTSKVSFGILAGVNFQNLNGKDSDGDKLENNLIPGFHAGVNVQIPIVPEFYFQPGLLFSTKGAKNTKNPTKTTTNISYIELPLNFVYKAMLGNGYIFLGLGPYIGYGIMGKVKTENGGESENDIEFQNKVETAYPLLTPPYHYKAFDVGGNMLFGYELGLGIFAQMNVQLGMVKINPEYELSPDDESVVKNTGFGLSFGYRF